MRELYREYKRYYERGSFNHIKDLTGNPKIDLKKEKVFKSLLRYLKGRSVEKERAMKNLAKVLNLSEAQVYELYRTYRKDPSRIKSKTLRSFLSNLAYFHSRDPIMREKALKRSKELLNLIKKEETYGKEKE